MSKRNIETQNSQSSQNNLGTQIESQKPKVGALQEENKKNRAGDVDMDRIHGDVTLPGDAEAVARGGALANMGTVKKTALASAKNPTPTTLADLHKEYKEYKLLRKKDQMSASMQVGAPAFVVADNWLSRYHSFILFDQFEADTSEQNLEIEPDHFTKNHPGKILSSQELVEADEKKENLYGSNSEVGLEASYADVYIDTKLKADQYHILNEELWQFLYNRYGGEEIKRFYIRKQNSNITSVEVRLTPLRVRYINANRLIDGKENKHNLMIWWTQCSQNALLKDVKRRLLDHLKSAGHTNLTMDDVRLWIYNQAQENSQISLEISCQQVINSYEAMAKEGTKLQNSQTDAPMADSKDEEEIEKNSEIEFPGQTVEPLCNSGLRIGQITLNKEQYIVVEYREKSEDSFAFQYNKGQKLFVGVCEWCNSQNILRVQCKCKNVRYCHEECQEKDKRFHLGKCSAQADGELQEDDGDEIKADSKKGLVGLSNLGNTCYLNSSIQCIANTYELTKYFLDRKYKPLVDREWKNPLGTEGRIVMAWAKLIGEMWRGNDSVVRPDLFKRILGQYNMTFEGYGQHDSQECLNTVLDFMSEDLYKQQKKPYVEQNETDGKSDEVASAEAWNKHILRNESIICDLFYGQLKSNLECVICKRISITFDPFLMLSLPIPSTKWEEVDGYFIQYHQNDKYQNYKLKVQIKDTDRLADLRERIQTQYGYNPGAFLISWVCDNKLVNLFNSMLLVKDMIGNRQGVLLFFEIPSSLNPHMLPPERINSEDSNNGIDSAWTKIVIHQLKEGQGHFNLPRVIWAKKDWTLKELHQRVFEYYRDIFVRWYKEISEKGSSDRSTKTPSFSKPGLNTPIDYEVLIDMIQNESLDVQFQTFFPQLTEQSWQQLLQKRNFDITDMPYQLKVENISRYMETCHFCGIHTCKINCPVPYSSSMTVMDMINKVGAEDNISFYNNRQGKQDFILNIVWQKDFDKNLIKHLSGMEMGRRIDLQDGEEDSKQQSTPDVSIEDCFNEFSKSEILDENNKWYCSKCKEHVRAKKQMQIYKAPPILVINLKRFRHSQGQSSRFANMYSGGGSQKIEVNVDFPLEGLDMSRFILGREAKENPSQYIYDCYAVSNHYGGLGFGHYTAYAKNPLTERWYEFDDSRVSAIAPQAVASQVRSKAAYNLFYRRRDWHARNMAQGVDFEALAIRPENFQNEKDQNK